MNIYAMIILGALILDFILSNIADVLNLKHMKTNLPEEFGGFYDEEKYRRSQQYTKVNTRFGFITDIFDLTIILLFWFSGGFNWLDHIVRLWNLPEIWTGVCYIGILMSAKIILSLPFSIYATFVIEERFGFNKTTPLTFILDRLKGLALSLLLGVPVLALILFIFQNLGEFAWLYGWIAVTAFSLFISYIAPTWILPLFNKFEPLDDEELSNQIFDYAESVDYSLAGVYKMDGSKRSSKSNAFFTGFGKNKRIALFDTLIEKHSIPELVTILAHEIGHYKKKHIIQGLVLGILQTGIMFYLLSIFLNHDGLFSAFYMEEKSVYAGLIFFGMLFSPIEFFTSIGLNLLSRHNEYQADQYACETTKDSDSMIVALKKLTVNNLSNLTPHPFYVFLNYSHPPVLQRIHAIRGLESSHE